MTTTNEKIDLNLGPLGGLVLAIFLVIIFTIVFIVVLVFFLFLVIFIAMETPYLYFKKKKWRNKKKVFEEK